VSSSTRRSAGDPTPADLLEGSFDQIWEWLVNVALRVLRDRDRAEDAAAQAIAKAWEKLEQFDPRRGNAYAWLQRVVRNTAIDILRGIRHDESLTAEADFPEQLLDGFPDPESLLLASARRKEVARLRELLHDAVASLPKEYRAALASVGRQGRPRSNIDEALNALREKLRPETLAAIRQMYREGHFGTE
jgi:RNA polymerase sigma factor (sigma-70 family)